MSSHGEVVDRGVSTGPAAPDLLGRTVGAVVLDWDGIAALRGGTHARGVLTRLRELSALGVHAVVVGDTPPAIDARLRMRPPGVEPGDASGPESLRDVLDRLDRLGVCGPLVLVVCEEPAGTRGSPVDDALTARGGHLAPSVVSVGVGAAGTHRGVRHLGGGPDALLSLLDEQLLRADRLRVPDICEDPRWTIVEQGVDPARRRVTASLFTVTSGGVGLRGSVEESPDRDHPLLVAAGVYSGPGVGDGLLHGPDVVDLHLDPPVTEDRRVLDLRTGCLHRTEALGSGRPVRSLRFGSVVEPGVFALRVEAATDRMHAARADGADGADEWRAVTSASGGIGVVGHSTSRGGSGTLSLQRLVAVDASPTGPPRAESARRRLGSATARGFEQLLAAQRAAWAQRWERVDIRIPDDPETELGLRFALFHLWGLSLRGRDLAVGARGLTGSGYAGHVFWDADVFVLPALATMDPRAAAAMVDYRLRRLAAARERARQEGRDGARFPWESGLTGRDVTPGQGFIGGERVPILSGELEEHITADVAWAALHRATWDGRPDRLSGDESVLLRDTARYWASRVTTDEDGSAHLRGVIGPDEYHERVDDNAFTNVMARWNLRAAAARVAAPDEERAAWSRLAEALVDGYDPDTGVYEQFRGFFGLQPLLVRELAEPPLAADVLAGRDVIAGSQVIKQPDALMIHHLVPEEAVPGSLGPTLDFYAPRTAHGSSLSPAVMASLHARAGLPDAALDLLRLSLDIDLADVGGTTVAGVHIAACGGAWYAVVAGFLGARVSRGRLELDPVLPDRWPDVEARFHCLGRDLRVRVVGDRLVVDASAGITVALPPGGRYQPSTSTAVRFVERRSP